MGRNFTQKILLEPRLSSPIMGCRRAKEGGRKGFMDIEGYSSAPCIPITSIQHIVIKSNKSVIYLRAKLSLGYGYYVIGEATRKKMSCQFNVGSKRVRIKVTDSESLSRLGAAFVSERGRG